MINKGSDHYFLAELLSWSLQLCTVCLQTLPMTACLTPSPSRPTSQSSNSCLALPAYSPYLPRLLSDPPAHSFLLLCQIVFMLRVMAVVTRLGFTLRQSTFLWVYCYQEDRLWARAELKSLVEAQLPDGWMLQLVEKEDRKSIALRWGRACMRGSRWRLSRADGSRLTVFYLWIQLGGVMQKGAGSLRQPTLLTSTDTSSPSSYCISFSKKPGLNDYVKSATTALVYILGLISFNFRHTASIFALVRLTTHTLKPSLASSSAKPSPMPSEPPVTTAHPPPYLRYRSQPGNTNLCTKPTATEMTLHSPTASTTLSKRVRLSAMQPIQQLWHTYKIQYFTLLAAMRTAYPLKQGQAYNIVQPLVKYLEQTDSPTAALAMRDCISQISALRNRVCTLQLPSNPNAQVVDKYLQIIEMYVRYARLIAKHFNWNPEVGAIVQDFNVCWKDSFNPQTKFVKPEIHYDIFCCYYNLGVLNFYKASLHCVEDFINSRKQAIQFAKRSFYYFNQMRTVYYPGFVNSNFSDTAYSHIEMLESLSLGIVYKCMFELFKEEEYRIGINKIASLAVLAQENFYRAYQIGVQFFMKSSYISNNIKQELLSFAYVESLYHDVIANTKFAKYYENLMDESKDNIVLCIAYQRKAFRLLNLGLTNDSVVHLLDQRPEQRRQLQRIKPELEKSLNTNINRNQQIYKKPEIPEQKLPPAFQAPQEYIVKSAAPKEIEIEYQTKNAAPFAKLIDNEAKNFVNQLKQFSKNRLAGLESAYSKIQKNVETIYNDCFVNYYLNLENNNKNKGIPENLKKKIDQIRMNGGKAKLDLEINIIKKNSELSKKSFERLRAMLLGEEQEDNQKRQQHGQMWKRPPSSVVQSSYRNNIDHYENKAKQADQVNQKIITKYEALAKFIALSEASDVEILAFLPKVQVTKFIEQNAGDFDKLKKGTNDVKQQMSILENITSELKSVLTQIDYSTLAQQYMPNKEQEPKQTFLERVFGNAYKLIEKFNEKAKNIQSNAKGVGQISTSLNNKNKGDDNNKKQFEIIMGKFNDVSNLFEELIRGTSFYTKLNDILSKLDNEIQGLVTARRYQASELEQSFGKKGGSSFGGPSLPNMYPNQQPQQNLGFYIPPPMQPDMQNQVNPYQQGNSEGSLSDMLKNLMSSKPSFSTDLFGAGNNNVYQSRYK